MPGYVAPIGTGEVSITVQGGQAADDTRALYSWLSKADQLRGRVRLLRPPPEPGRLGGVVDTLVVALGPAGALVGLAGALSAWVRHRGSDAKLTVEGTNGRRVVFEGQRLGRLDVADIARLAGELTTLVDEPDERAEAPATPGDR